MRSTVALAITLVAATGCATTSLQASSGVWVHAALTEHRAATLDSAAVTRFPDGAVGMMRVRLRTDQGELADYTFPDGVHEPWRSRVTLPSGEVLTDDGRHFLEGTLAPDNRGFRVPSTFEARGNARCLLVTGALDDLHVGSSVRAISLESGAVGERLEPLALESARDALLLVFDATACELSVYLPPPGGRSTRREDGREKVSVASDGGWRLKFRGPVDWGYVKSTDRVAWYYAHLPLALAFDALFLPFSLVKLAIYHSGLEDGVAHPFLWPWELPPRPI